MERISFTEGWQFGEAGAPLRAVTVPHDAMQEKGRAADAPSGAAEAYFLGGSYVYEKRFLMPANWAGETLALAFEGVYPRAEVFFNGAKAGGSAYGYGQFSVPLAGARYGEENVVRVLVNDENHPNSRWYGGAGIFRPVWLLRLPQNHIAPDGVRIETRGICPAVIRVTADAVLAAENPAAGSAEQAAGLVAAGYSLRHEIYDGARKVAEVSAAIGAAAEITVPDAKLWSAEQPCLYTCKTVLLQGGEAVDTQENRFGIRTISWSTQGFFVNGTAVKLRGGCVHHDHGILGARDFAKSDWRRMQRLKEFGFNAVRSAHNPMSRASLEACDALGLYVMDETWDTWTNKKNPYDFGNGFADRYEDDLQKLVEKDFNHPSVVMYSIGNEVTEPWQEEGVRLGHEIAAKLKALDGTRPLTAGLNLTLLMMAKMQAQAAAEAEKHAAKAEGGAQAPQQVPQQADSTAFNNQVQEMGRRMVQAAAMPAVDALATPILQELDICGYNYGSSRYAIEAEQHPERVLVGSETFPNDLADNWDMVEHYPYLIGDFMWTAWDYIGEVGIGGWVYAKDIDASKKPYPWLLADAGAIDILGDATGEAGLAAVLWRAGQDPYIGVRPANHKGCDLYKAMWRWTDARPHWSYQGCEGNPVTVEVYTRGAEAELLLNEQVIGRKAAEKRVATFETTYRPGRLVARSYDEKGARIGERCLSSADGEKEIQIVPEGAARVGELLYVNINIADKTGVLECNDDDTLTVQVEGGQLLAFGSANPRTEEIFLSGTYTTYYGRSQAAILVEKETVRIAVRGDRHAPRDMTLTAK